MQDKFLKFLSHGASHVVLATMGGNIISYFFNLLAQRWLSVEDFGHSTATINLILILGLVSLSLTYTITKYASWHTHQNANALPGFIRASRTFTVYAAVFISVLLILLFLPLTTLFKLPASLAVFTTLTISSSLLLLLSWQRGVLAGTKKYSSYALSLMIENTVKLFVIFLPLPISALDKFLVSIPLGMIASFLFSQINYPVLNPQRLLSPSLPINSKKYLRFFLASLYTTSCIQVLLFADVLFVKARFSAATAGQYATLVLIGKIIYFCVNSLIAILIPEISHQHAQKLPVKAMLIKSLVGGFGIGIFLTLTFSFIPHLSLFVLLEKAKTLPVINLIPLYGLAATAISLIIITSTTLLVVGYRFFLPLVSIFFLIEAIILAFYVTSLTQVVLTVSIISLLLLGLIIIITIIETRLKTQKQFALSRA